jgi:hypothetical protein
VKYWVKQAAISSASRPGMAAIGALAPLTKNQIVTFADRCFN